MAFLTRPADTAWVVDSGFADNTVAVAAKLAEASKSHYITGVRASYSDPSAKGELTLEIGGEDVFRTHVHGSVYIPFDAPLKTQENTSVFATLSPSDTPGVTGSVILIGYTI